MKINKDILILSISFLFIFLGYGSVERFITSFFADAGIANIGFHSLILIYVFFTLFTPLAAILISKYGAKKAMIRGSLTYAIFLFILIMKSIPLLYAASALLGIGAALLWTAQNIYLIKSSDKKRYGRDSGIFTTIFPLGPIIGMISLGILIKYLSFDLPFFLFAIFPLIGFLLLFRLKNIQTEQRTNYFKLMKKSITNITALRLSTIWFALSFVLGLAIGILPINIKSTFGIAYVGILSAMFSIFPVIFSYLSGKISDIKGRKQMILISYFILIVGLSSLYFTGKITMILGIVLLAISSAILRVVTMAMVGDVTTDKNIEFITALFWFIQNVGAVSALLLSTIIQTSAIYLLSLATMFILILIILPVLKLPFPNIRKKLAKEII